MVAGGNPWRPALLVLSSTPVQPNAIDIERAVRNPGQTAYLWRDPTQGMGVSLKPLRHDQPYEGALPGIGPSSLGDPSMLDMHRMRLPYICGEMANGIATVGMVKAMAAEGLLGFFGAAGLPLERIEAAVAELAESCGGQAWGSNLIHSPQDPELEESTVDVYLKHGVQRVSTSAFLALRPSVVRYAYRGIRAHPDGSILRRNHVFAKISRPEVAHQFLSPAPEAMLDALVAGGKLTAEEACLARFLPVAEDITAEADSAGHTDNRPLTTLLPAIQALRDEAVALHRYTRPVRVGAAGGLGTPMAVAAAFSLGAAYVLTGSINQCTRESGQSEAARQMLAQAGTADIAMAPAGDMFEMGVKVQVLKRGTLFAARASKLYEIYKRYHSIEEIPPEMAAVLQREIFRQDMESVWKQTQEYFLLRNPADAHRAEREPRHRMALVFRWYLGQSARWPLQGDPDRRIDYQIWCGPSMGAFNQWVAGSFLEDPARRTVAQIALNLMYGAASVTRAHQLRCCGVKVPARLFQYPPRPLPETSSAASAFVPGGALA
jgi:trans-AT polyketide synthase/acyltransferase/oxidoreductase domain-containing protein